jgi:hypothetical protein
MAIKTCVIGSLVVCATATALAGAQSLGDVAKKESERRKAVPASGKTYTNDNLRVEPAPAAVIPAATPAVATPAAEATPAASVPKDGSPKPDGAAKDEAYWRKRLTDARTSLERSKSFAEALQSRINALTADFSARSDPAQRAVIGADRQKALDELTRVTKEIEGGTKAISDIQDEARKAGVPAGWIR